MSEDKNGVSPLAGFVPVGLLSLFTGGGTTAQQQTVNLPALGSIPWLGSALMGVVGGIGLVILWIFGPTRKSWAIITLGFLLDFVLSILFVWPIRDTVAADPLALLPYALGTLATFLAGLFVGFVASESPLLLASGIVSLDFVLAGILGVAAPHALGWALLSRIVAGYGAVLLGALIGDYARVAVREDPKALGKCLGAGLFAIVTAVISGLITSVIGP